MTIYGRFNDVVTLKRFAVLEDVERLEGRKPDAIDLEAIEHGFYVVVEQDDGTEGLYHQAYLRAANGIVELQQALARLTLL